MLPRNAGADLSSQFTQGWRQRTGVPDLASANISLQIASHDRRRRDARPILMGMTRPVHLLPRGAEVEEIFNAVAMAVVDARQTELTAKLPEIEKSVAQAD